jgi:ketosteroid isomerase-like protein
VSSHTPVPDNPENEELAPNSAADEFFIKMKHDFRRPKPSEEAIAAAMQAMQNLMSGAIVEGAPEKSSQHPAAEACPKCGAANTGLNRFCGYCGALLKIPAANMSKAEAESAPASAQHIYHHHYHYFAQPENNPNEPRVWTGASQQSAQVEWPTQEATEPEDLEKTIHKLIRDWSLYFNSKRLDDLLALYSSDAIVLRSSVAAAQGSEAIRQVLESSLKEGLGDVDLECSEIGMVEDFACITGRSKMLVPVAPGKRQEQAGKYLIVARRYSGEWKIIADSWCMDSKPAQVPATSTAVLPMRAAQK